MTARSRPRRPTDYQARTIYLDMIRIVDWGTAKYEVVEQNTYVKRTPAMYIPYLVCW